MRSLWVGCVDLVTALALRGRVRAGAPGSRSRVRRPSWPRPPRPQHRRRGISDALGRVARAGALGWPHKLARVAGPTRLARRRQQRSARGPSRPGVAVPEPAARRLLGAPCDRRPKTVTTSRTGGGAIVDVSWSALLRSCVCRVHTADRLAAGAGFHRASSSLSEKSSRLYLRCRSVCVRLDRAGPSAPPVDDSGRSHKGK